MSDWYPTRWWRAVGPDGKLWAESSDEDEIREMARPGDRLEQLFERRETQWRIEGAGQVSDWVDDAIKRAEVKRLRGQVAAVQQLATVARQERLPVPADLILDRLASGGETT